METSAQPQKSLNWKNVLIGVVIGAVCIGLGVLIWFLLQPKPTSTPTTTTKQAAPSATPSAQKDETADWKTFTNSKGGYVIKYPTSLRQPEPKDLGIYGEEVSFYSNSYEETKSQSSMGVEVTVDNGFKIVTTSRQSEFNKIEDWISNYSTDPKGQYIKLDGINGFRLTDNPGPTMRGHEVSAVIYKSKLYEIFFFYANKDEYQNGLEIYNKILSTFGFD